MFITMENAMDKHQTQLLQQIKHHDHYAADETEGNWKCENCTEMHISTALLIHKPLSSGRYVAMPPDELSLIEDNEEAISSTDYNRRIITIMRFSCAFRALHFTSFRRQTAQTHGIALPDALAALWSRWQSQFRWNITIISALQSVSASAASFSQLAWNNMTLGWQKTYIYCVIDEVVVANFILLFSVKCSFKI